MIYSYQKHIDPIRTVEMVLPTGDDHQRLGVELATIDGTTYVYLPDGVTLPGQPPEISVTAVELTADQVAAVTAASPHVRLVNSRVVEMIREQYSIEDELKLLRLGPGDEFTAYNAYVEECRTWGRGQKALFGL